MSLTDEIVASVGVVLVVLAFIATLISSIFSDYLWLMILFGGT